MSEALFDAVRGGDAAVVEALLADRPGLARAVLPAAAAPHGAAGITALHLAVAAGQAEIVRLLVAAGAELDARNGEGRTALHDSIELGQRRITELLIAAGAEVDVCSAAILGRLGRLRRLLDADPGLVSDRRTGLSPLAWAAYGNQTGTAAELLRRGARPDDGELLCAASVGHVEVGRVLLEHGADPNEIHPGAAGNALHAAAGMRYTDDATAFVVLLLEAGADPAIRSRDGSTALEIAEAGSRRQAEPGGAASAKRWQEVAELLGVASTGE